jgi:hypothetical protein
MDLKKGDVRCKDKANGVRLIVSMSDKRAAKDKAMRKKTSETGETLSKWQTDKSER